MKASEPLRSNCHTRRGGARGWRARPPTDAAPRRRPVRGAAPRGARAVREFAAVLRGREGSQWNAVQRRHIRPLARAGSHTRPLARAGSRAASCRVCTLRVRDDASRSQGRVSDTTTTSVTATRLIYMILCECVCVTATCVIHLYIYKSKMFAISVRLRVRAHAVPPLRRAARSIPSRNANGY